MNVIRKKKKKHDKILVLAKSELNIIETLILQALIDMDISHEEFITILKEKDKSEKMKENLKIENENENSMKLWDWLVWNKKLKKNKNEKSIFFEGII